MEDVNHQAETTRLETFCDGVFAIAITLLVLELIQILNLQTEGGILKSFLHHWQPFLAFLVGFMTIMVCWVNHHHAFQYIDKTDDGFMWVNGFLLFMVTLTPLATAILAESIETDGKTALTIFGLNFFLIAIAAYLICKYAYDRKLVAEKSREYFRCIKKTYGISILYTLVVFIICFISPYIAIVLYIIMFAVFALPKNFANFLLSRERKKGILSIKS